MSSDLKSALKVYENLCKFYGITFNIEASKKFFSVRGYFEQHNAFVAFDVTTKEVIGLAFSEMHHEETQETSGYIKLIYVEENYRRQGIMTGLINACIDDFKNLNLDQVRIYLRNENLPYLSYYSEKLGFSPIITIVEKELK